MYVYLSLWFYCLLYVVIDVSLLVVVHVSHLESTASWISTSVLPDRVVTTPFRLRLSRSFLFLNRKLTRDLINLLSDQKVYITRRIFIVRRISPKRCSKSYIALFLSNTHLRRFYSLVNYRYYSLLPSINPQFFHKLIGPPWQGCYALPGSVHRIIWRLASCQSVLCLRLLLYSITVYSPEHDLYPCGMASWCRWATEALPIQSRQMVLHAELKVAPYNTCEKLGTAFCHLQVLLVNQLSFSYTVVYFWCPLPSLALIFIVLLLFHIPITVATVYNLSWLPLNFLTRD